MRGITIGLRILRDREEFEYWLFDMDDAIEGFLESLSIPVRGKLDSSPDSLDVLEAWLLDRYPKTESMLDRYEFPRVDDAARYIGETFRRTLGGYWDIKLDHPKNAYFGLPILTGFERPPTPICPLLLATASVDRRTGSYCKSK